jgi:lipoate-protein ligase A
MPTNSSARWRLLDTGPADGFTNMAVDEAIMVHHATAGGLPTVRFYSWSPPAVSLGYGQSMAADIDLDRCRTLGIDVVRRPTGGRAVLHDREVTYSVVFRADHPRATPGILAAYLMVSRALVRGLSYLGVSAELLPPRGSPPIASEPANPVCFARPSSYEVAVGGRKIVGSAQRRTQGVIMQHGSLPLSLDLDKLCSLLGASPSARRAAEGINRYRAHIIDLAEAAGRQYDYNDVVAALSRGFAETWEVELIPGTLTSSEHCLSVRLRASKYRSQRWAWQR